MNPFNLAIIWPNLPNKPKNPPKISVFGALEILYNIPIYLVKN